MLDERAAVARRETDLKSLGCLTIEAALVQKLPGCDSVRAAQVLGKEVRRYPEGLS
jgi:hypothetical protein